MISLYFVIESIDLGAFGVNIVMLSETDILSYLSFSQFKYNSIIFDLLNGQEWDTIGSGGFVTSSKYGLKLSPTQQIYNSSFLYPDNFNMSVGFWFFSVNPGIADNINNNEITSLNLSLLSFYVYNASRTNKYPFIYISENTDLDNRNFISIYIFDLSDTSLQTYVRVDSEHYDSQAFHHVAIDFDSTITNINYSSNPDEYITIYLDGIEQTLSVSGTIGAIPFTFSDYGECYINKNSLNSSYYTTSHYGYINELFVSKTLLDTNPIELQNIINYSLYYDIYDIDNIYMNTGIFYPDVQTKQINSVSPVKDVFYVGTNTGELWMADVVKWQGRKMLDTETRLENVDFGPDSSYSLESDYLLLSRGSIINL